MWFYVTADRQQAEVSDDEMPSRVSSGVITPDTLVWKEGMANWQPARAAAAHLFPAATAAPEPEAPADAGWSAPPATHVSGSPALYAPAPPASGLATTSLVCGILSMICLGPIAAIPGAICGHIAIGQNRSQPHIYGGRELAIAGVVLSYISLGLLIITGLVYFILMVGFFAAAGM